MNSKTSSANPEFEPVANLTIDNGYVTLAAKILPDGVYNLYTHQPTQSQPDLSGLKPATQKQIKEWIADGTFVERAIGAMQEQEAENMRLEKTQAKQHEPLTNGEIYTAYIAATNQMLRAQDEKLALAFARTIEAAHGIKD